MYKVYCDGIAIYDLFSPDLMLLDPVLQLELNSPGTFEFTIPLDHPYYDLPQEMLSRVWVTRDDEEIFRGRVIEEEIDWYKRKKVYCEGELAFLNDSIQRPAEYHDMTVRGYFETLIEEHNAQVEEDKQFEVGYVLVEDTNDSLYRYTNYNSTLTEMKEDLVDDLGGYIRVRNQNGRRYLDYINIEDYGERNTQAIRFGINLLDFSQTMDVSDIATVIIPLGEQLEESPIEALNMRLTIESVNGGSDAIESEEAVKTYGRITKTVVWDDVTLPENLLTNGKKYLSDYQWDNLVLEVTPVDLHDSDPDTESFNLGDQLRVVSSPHGLDKYFPLSAMTIHLDSLDQNTFVLGTEIAGKTLTGALQTAIDQVVDVEKEITPTQILLHEAQEQASALINAATHGYVVLQPNDEPEEILIMDAPDYEDSYRIWRWNMGGLGYGTRENTNDDFFFETAMTMDGSIVADFITTGTLTADIIRAGTIQDLQKNSYWNLNTGRLVINGDKFMLDSEGNFEIHTNQFILDSSGNASFSGMLNAPSGKIGGWTISDSAFYYNITSLSDNSKEGTYIGTDGIRNTSKFDSYTINSTTIKNGGIYCNSYGSNCNISGDTVRIVSTDESSSDYDTDLSAGYFRMTNYNGNTAFRVDPISYSGDPGEFEVRLPVSIEGDVSIRGSISSTGGYLSASDANIKKNLMPLKETAFDSDALFDSFKVKTFEYVSDEKEKTYIGFTYQDMVSSLEEDGIDPDTSALVGCVEDCEGTKNYGIDYNNIVALLVDQVQNLKAAVKELKADINKLKAQLE